MATYLEPLSPKEAFPQNAPSNWLSLYEPCGPFVLKLSTMLVCALGQFLMMPTPWARIMEHPTKLIIGHSPSHARSTFQTTAIDLYTLRSAIAPEVAAAAELQNLHKNLLSLAQFPFTVTVRTVVGMLGPCYVHTTGLLPSGGLTQPIPLPEGLDDPYLVLQ